METDPKFFRLIYSDVYSENFLVNRPDLIPMAEQRYATLDLSAAVRLIESFQRFNITSELPKIKTPTCIISAELDLLKPRRYGELMHKAIADSEFHLIPNAGHVVVLEKANEVKYDYSWRSIRLNTVSVIANSVDHRSLLYDVTML